MTLRNLLQDEAPPQQKIPIVRVCWDELFALLRTLFRPKAEKPWTALGNLHGETSQEYKAVFTAIVPDDFTGILEEVSLYSSRPDTTLWELVIVDTAEFTGKRIYTSLTLPYKVGIKTGQKVVLKARTDGTATNIAGSLAGKLQFLGG